MCFQYTKKELKSLIKKPTFALNFQSSIFQWPVSILPTSGSAVSKSTNRCFTNPI